MPDELRAETAAGFVRNLRSELCVTQIELARLVWTDRAPIARLELGREPRLPTLRRMVAALGGRLELAARFERPLEAMAEALIPGRMDARMERDLRRQERRLRKRAASASGSWPEATPPSPAR